MRWLRTGLFFLAGLVTLLVMLVALVVSVDFGRFKSKAEVLVSEQLGREFRIDGDLHLNLGRSIELLAEDVFLANPAWAEEGGFFTVRKIDVSVDTWSLINGPIIVQRAEIDGITVNLEKSLTGESSWEFDIVQAEPVEQPEDLQLRPRLPVILNYAAISDIRVTYDNPELETPIVFVADSFRALREENDFINTELTGVLNGTPVNATAVLAINDPEKALVIRNEFTSLVFICLNCNTVAVQNFVVGNATRMTEHSSSRNRCCLRPGISHAVIALYKIDVAEIMPTADQVDVPVLKTDRDRIIDGHRHGTPRLKMS